MKLDRKQDFNALYQVCVFRLISKQKWPPWPIHQKGGILYTGFFMWPYWPPVGMSWKQKFELGIPFTPLER